MAESNTFDAAESPRPEGAEPDDGAPASGPGTTGEGPEPAEGTGPAPPVDGDLAPCTRFSSGR